MAARTSTSISRPSPWPWPDNSISNVLLRHVLEHLGQDPKVFLQIGKELYRVCQPGARVLITVPHHRHESFFSDPTHVRAITPEGLALFSTRLNREAIATGLANTPLGLHYDVEFEIINTALSPSSHWKRLNPGAPEDPQLLLRESAVLNNLIEQLDITIRVVK